MRQRTVGRAENRTASPILSARALRVALRLLGTALEVIAIIALTWLWKMTKSVVPEEHADFDSALRELRSLDRTLNQDVLKRRFHVIRGYDPVRRSYRRIEELEARIAVPPRYLDPEARRMLVQALEAYRAAVTTKQRLIEDHKYLAGRLEDLLAYLPGAGIGVAQTAASNRQEHLADQVKRVLQLVLLYNLTSNGEYALSIRRLLDDLEKSGESARSAVVRRGVRTLTINIRALLQVRPDVDGLLVVILNQPVPAHEDSVARVYGAGYAAAERAARRYRFLLYGLSVALLGAVGYAVIRLRRTAAALAASKADLELRTRELGRRNLALGTVLDNVGQALVTVDLAGCMSEERSLALDQWFPEGRPGAHIATTLGGGDAEQVEWIAFCWEQLQADFLPIETALGQLPTTFARGDRFYDVGYRPIDGAAGPEKILVVISDVTEARGRARSEVEQREQLIVFQDLMKDRAELLEFFAECERLAATALADPPSDRRDLLRAIHTLKGIMSMRDIDSVAAACHALEEKVSEPGAELTAGDRAGLVEAWEAFAARVRALTRAIPEDRVELARAELQAVRDPAAAGASGEQIAAMLSILEHEPAVHRLEHMAADARRLAQRLGKDGLVVTVEAEELRFERRRWAPFWAALVHVVRNAIDHGVEPPDERVAAGKPRAGQLVLRALWAQDRGAVIIEISDDGRGIDWDAVRERARALGGDTGDEAALARALLTGGISTKAVATETSGRGAGVAACHDSCMELGGQITIESKRHRGTTFRFTFPSYGVGQAGLPEVVTREHPDGPSRLSAAT